MSDDRRPLSEQSRQELLDEIYLLRDVAGEREQQILERDSVLTALQSQLESVLLSRSWRVTAPLRWVARRLGHAKSLTVETAVAEILSNAELQRPESPGDSDCTSPQFAAPIEDEDRSDGKPRLYVDITELALRGGRTGVQRVTREILRALLDAPPAKYRVQPVYAPPRGTYRCACASSLLMDSPLSSEGSEVRVPDTALSGVAGDVFLGLDHAMDAVIANADQLAGMHERGVRLWFVCSDVLPVSHPEWFPPKVPAAFGAWLETIIRVAEGVACISRATESEIQQQLRRFNVPREKPLALVHFSLGAGLPVRSDDAAAVTPEDASVIDHLRGVTSFLMVGTLEPRKGHAQTVQAFESLWADGSDVVLVIAGFPGWMTAVLARRIRHHEEFGKRLFWFMGPDDAVLDRLYSACTALLVPSEGEGFGLPLVEAARHGLPILCRDLPAFREVAGEHAAYFSGQDPVSLATALRGWLAVRERGMTVSSAGMPCVTWAQSAQQLLDGILENVAP